MVSETPLKPGRNIERFLRVAREEVTLLDSRRKGISSEQIRGEIVRLLSPYFDNIQVVTEGALENVTHLAIIYERLASRDHGIETFEYGNRVFREAKRRHRADALALIVDSYGPIYESVAKFWRLAIREHDKSQMEFQELAEEIFDNLGSIIEGMLKPILQLVYAHVKLLEGVQIRFSEAARHDLGIIVDYLERDAGLRRLLRIKNVRLSQWRNVAAHHSFSMDGEEVAAFFGRGKSRKTINLTRADLMDILLGVARIYHSLKLAYDVYFHDNVCDVAGSLKLPRPRVEAELVPFASALAANGFELLDFTTANGDTRFRVRDVTGRQGKEVGIHSSQFVFRAWLITQDKRVTVQLVDFEEKVLFETVAHGKDIASYREGKITLDEMVEAMEFKQLEMS